jgi:hypothetical protein
MHKIHVCMSGRAHKRHNTGRKNSWKRKTEKLASQPAIHNRLYKGSGAGKLCQPPMLTICQAGCILPAAVVSGEGSRWSWHLPVTRPLPASFTRQWYLLLYPGHLLPVDGGAAATGGLARYPLLASFPDLQSPTAQGHQQCHGGPHPTHWHMSPVQSPVEALRQWPAQTTGPCLQPDEHLVPLYQGQMTCILTWRHVLLRQGRGDGNPASIIAAHLILKPIIHRCFLNWWSWISTGCLSQKATGLRPRPSLAAIPTTHDRSDQPLWHSSSSSIITQTAAKACLKNIQPSHPYLLLIPNIFTHT